MYDLKLCIELGVMKRRFYVVIEHITEGDVAAILEKLATYMEEEVEIIMMCCCFFIFLFCVLETFVNGWVFLVQSILV